MRIFERIRLFLLPAILAISTVIASSAWAASSAEKAHTKVELFTRQQAVRPGQSVDVALRMTMEPDWHTYWLNPGDTGIPTSVRWTLPEGFSAGDIRWPAPHVIEFSGLVNYGYEGEVDLLMTITTPAELPGVEEVSLKARVEWLACKVECVPGDADLELVLPVRTGPLEDDPRWAEAVTRTLPRLPVEDPSVQFKVREEAKSFQLEFVTADRARKFPSPRFFPARNDILDHSAVQRVQAVPGGYALTLMKGVLAPPSLDRLQGVLASEGTDGHPFALSVNVPVAQPFSVGTPVPGAAAPGLGVVMLLAFCGGLILNLMPCVLPVLSIKLLNVVRHRHTGRSAVLHAGVFGLGVLVSFWGLALVLLVLRGLGNQIGWGFQFQSPVFLSGLAVLFLAMSMNLFGVFEIVWNVPGADGRGTTRSEWWGDFLSGLLTTVVATPCTAPFMGTAIGVAVVQPPIVALAIFTSLGLGLAAPFAVLAVCPGLLRFVPKPGRWMEYFKKVLGVPLLATAVWLGWVLGLQKGMEGVALLVSGSVLLAVGLWVLGKWTAPSRARTVRRKAWIVAGLLLAGGIGLSLSSAGVAEISARTVGAGHSEDLGWQDFSPEKIAQARGRGQPVFVDFTASWCLSCQANERFVLNRPEVVDAFRKKNVVMLKADWTRRDPRITAALEALGKNSIPVYLLYPADPVLPPVMLPEILTPKIVIEALEKI